MNQLQTNQKSLSNNYLYPYHCFILQWLVIDHVDAWSEFQRERSQHSLKITPVKCPLGSQKVVKRFEWRSFKGCWGLVELEHGNLTSNQVILYQEIQFLGMDFVFFPYTLPVYPHPESQRFPFLIHSPLPHQRPPCLFWRSFFKNLSQPSVTDIPGHPNMTPAVHTYTRPLKLSLFF